MQYLWLNQKDENKKLIVFFNGWAMNETAVKHLDFENYDILMFFDYRRFDFEFNFDFSKYEEKYLVCWSMGVYFANLFEEKFKNFNKKIAINGTNKIINNVFGICERVYKLTIRLFNEESCDKFIKNMFDEKINPNIKISRTLNDLKEELISIQKINLEKEMNYNCAIVSLKDEIVPTENQLNYWGNRAEIIKIDAPHYPFDNFSKWGELLC